MDMLTGDILGNTFEMLTARELARLAAAAPGCSACVAERVTRHLLARAECGRASTSPAARARTPALAQLRAWEEDAVHEDFAPGWATRWTVPEERVMPPPAAVRDD